MPVVASLTSDGLTIQCLLFEHDWHTEYAVSHFFPADIVEGLTGRESRRPEAEALLLTVGVKLWAEDADAQTLRQTLATLGTKWVGVPILADQFLGANVAAAGARIYSPQRYIRLTTPTAGIIAAAETVYWRAHGRSVGDTVVFLGGDAGGWSSLVAGDPYCVVATPTADTLQLSGAPASTPIIVGASTGGVFGPAPVIVAAGSTLVAGDTYAPLVVGHITELPAIEPAAGALAICGLTLTEDSPWAFRIGINANPAPSEFPAALEPDWTTPPTQQPAHGLSFERIGHQREQTIAGQERALVWNCTAKFGLIDKTEVATLLGFFLNNRGSWGSFTAPLWFTPGTATSEAPHLTVVRFTERTLKLTYTSSQVAEAEVGFTQVPWEIVGVGGETPQQPARIFLYQVTYALPTPQIYRFTNCWRPLTRAGDGTYAPAPWEHEAIEGGLDLSNEKVTLHSFLFDGNPLDLFNPNVLEGRMLLRIFEVGGDPLAPDDAVQVWFGAIAAAPQTGRKYEAECLWLGGITDMEIPNVRIGPMCNTYLFSKPCGHLKATFAKAGTLSTSADTVVVVSTADAVAANTYGPGRLEVGTGLGYESRFITASTPVVGGQQFTLDRPLRQAAAGQAVTYSRTCGRELAKCKELDPTGWKARFRGHPNLSQVALSLPTQNSALAGKK
ncbi:MAG: hypothetical protein JSS11_06360 [Verrucomicrobia bacterium]|nr:hypothetical protein [Verrucomicrobiota bacterium]